MRLAIDPGKNAAGWALFDPFGVLLAAGHLKRPDWATHGIRHLIALYGHLQCAVIEKPQAYQIQHQKGDQQDLIDLGVMVGKAAGELENGCPVSLVLPKEWKGQIPKEVTKARVDGELIDAEKKRIKWPKADGERHNVYDAIHLGLRTFTKRKA